MIVTALSHLCHYSFHGRQAVYIPSVCLSLSRIDAGLVKSQKAPIVSRIAHISPSEVIKGNPDI